MRALRRDDDTGGQQRGPRQAALPFAVLGLVFIVGASSTMLPTGLAFALAAGCVLIGSLRVLLVYRDGLVASRATGEKR